MYARQRRPVLYRQKGGYYYQNGVNPNQEGGDYYQNGVNPNQEGGFGQSGGARTKGSLRRQYAADALLRLAGSTPRVRKTRQPRRLNFSLSPIPASTPVSPMSDISTPVGSFSSFDEDSPDYTLADFSSVHRKGVNKRGPGGKRKTRATADNHNLLMVKQFKIANPSVKANDLHALSGGWKLHGTKLGEERKGYRPACMRMAALLGEKMYSSPTSPWMTKMRNGEPLDLMEECNKLRRNTPATPAITSTVVAEATRKKPGPTRKSSRKRKAPVMFGRGAGNQKGGFLPLLPLLTMAAPALAKLVT